MDLQNRPLETMDLSDNARAVLRKRYLKKDADGNPTEEPLDMFHRVADTIASAERTFAKDSETGEFAYEKHRDLFLELMTSLKFMPNSPTLMNAGRDLGQLSACFVLPIEDSMESIYDTLKHQALIHKSGGGTGFAFSRLRPKGGIVRSTMGVSSGPVSFMSVFDASTEHIKQGGTRRGANMGILRVDHPDIEEFIDCKRESDRINNFNISVAITDEFMDAVSDDSDFDLRDPRDGNTTRTLRARFILDRIVEGAWLNGEPGVVFIDRIDGDNPTPQFPIEATNPCSEAHLPPYDSCNLGSINLARFIFPPSEDDLPTEFASPADRVDWLGLAETVKTAIRFLDNVVEVNNYPLPEISEMSRGNRRLGLGVMGFADALVELGVPYGGPEAYDLADSMMEWVDSHAWAASRLLAKERGTYPNFEGSRHEADGDPVRNATVTTIAPTGTISIISGCSGGIEPLFAVAFMRRQADMLMPDVNPAFVKLAKDRGFFSEDLMTRVAESGTLKGVSGVPDDVREIFTTSGDLSAEDHVRMQAVFQRHTSMGISKTINLPKTATREDVANAYLFAYEAGCKGVAVYRDGSRDEQVFSTTSTAKTDIPASGAASGAANGTSANGTKAAAIEPQKPPPTLAEARNGRPRTLTGVTKKIATGHGPLYVTMNEDEFGPRETFVLLGKPGGTASAFSDALGRMISLAHKYGATPADVVGQLRGIQDGHPAGVGETAVHSVPDAVAKAMAEHYLLAASDAPTQAALPIIGACPECGGPLRSESACVVCVSGGCGFSRCS